jgi:hypothetical protein
LQINVRRTDPVSLPVYAIAIRHSFVRLFYQMKCAQNKIAVSLSVDQQRRQKIVLHHPVV